MLLARVQSSYLKNGALTIIDADGGRHLLGDGTGKRLIIRLHEKALHRKLVLNPRMAFGEAYMEGSLTVEEGDIYEVLALFLSNMGWRDGTWVDRLAGWPANVLRRLHQFNPVRRAQRNVAHHYDLSGALYDLFLDRDRQYSCAYFASPGDSLEAAQLQKKRHLAAKLLLNPGARVLDIGSGWGGLALYLADAAGAHVTGLTLSEEQVAESRRRAEETDHAERVRFHLRDYREEQGTYDRIVSVGMFEHVGVNHYATYFNKVKELLTEDGVAVLHTIGRADGPGSTNPWIRKYIFPGGYSPALSEIMTVIERVGLYVTDIEVLRLHYAETLREWRRRFNLNRARIAEIYDERFCRMWEFYLAGSEATFRFAGHVVFQIQLAKNQAAVPLTRDYVSDWERARERRDSVAA